MTWSILARVCQQGSMSASVGLGHAFLHTWCWLAAGLSVWPWLGQFGSVPCGFYLVAGQPRYDVMDMVEVQENNVGTELPMILPHFIAQSKSNSLDSE